MKLIREGDKRFRNGVQRGREERFNELTSVCQERVNGESDYEQAAALRI